MTVRDADAAQYSSRKSQERSQKILLRRLFPLKLTVEKWTTLSGHGLYSLFSV